MTVVAENVLIFGDEIALKGRGPQCDVSFVVRGF